jgi:hypothetical protein
MAYVIEQGAPEVSVPAKPHELQQAQDARREQRQQLGSGAPRTFTSLGNQRPALKTATCLSKKKGKLGNVPTRIIAQ